MDSKLVEKTLELLKSRPYTMTVKQITEKTSIPEGWIKQLQRGKIKEPSAPRIEKLYEFLSGHKLTVE